MGRALNRWGIAVSALAAVLMVGAAIVPGASASEGCENEARRAEQGATFLPDCRAYELVSQPYQPTPRINLQPEGVPFAEATEFVDFTEYPREPVVLPRTSDRVLSALDGNAAMFEAWTPNSESWEIEAPINLSRRGQAGWTGENIMPTESEHAGYGCNGSTVEGFSPNLEQIAIRLGGGGDGEDYAHCGHDEPYLAGGEGESTETANLFLRDTTSRSWQLVSIYPPGVKVWSATGCCEYSEYRPVFNAVSADGSHVVFASQAQLTADAPNAETITRGHFEGHCAAEFGNVYVWSGGADRLLAVPPDGIPARGTLAGAHAGSAIRPGCARAPQQTASFTNPVSAHGERILFYAGGGFKLQPTSSFSQSPGPRAPYIGGGLYMREHPGAEQSALSRGGAAGTGTLATGEDTVSSLRVTAAAGFGGITAGSDEVTYFTTTTGEFRVGQAIEGEGIPAGTTIAAISEKTNTSSVTGAKETIPVLILSNDATESRMADYEPVKLVASSEGPAPFAIGQSVTGRGIPAGTTIIAVAPGSLTLSNAATASGSGVSLEASSECTEAEKACTVQIDAPDAGAAGSPGEGQFQWANAETTKVFFTDEERLTSDATAQAGEPDLYEYDVEKPQSQRLTDLTVNASAAADVLGVAGASEGGSYVYFVAKGVLAANENNHNDKAIAGEANLYVRHAGTTTFIATLNAEGGDQCDWTAYCLTSRVSQNGEYIAFNSISELTGYDNHPLIPTACSYLTSGDPKSTEEAPCIEAFRYAAQSGELTCATCNPHGRPESRFAWSLVPQAYREGASANYGYQTGINHPMTNAGEFFFETMEKLLPEEDQNKTWDVYEYSGGEGPSARYHLISTGRSEQPSELEDASTDGSSVFFVTTQSLLRIDTNSDYSIYDARIGGGFVSQSKPAQAPSCGEEGACRPPLSEPPAELSPASAGLFGSGNLTPAPETKRPAKCGKGRVRRHGKCVKRRHGKRHSKRRRRQLHHRHHRAGGKRSVARAARREPR